MSRKSESTGDILAKLKSNGVLLSEMSHSTLRAVTHLDVSMEQINKAAEIITISSGELKGVLMENNKNNQFATDRLRRTPRSTTQRTSCSAGRYLACLSNNGRIRRRLYDDVEAKESCFCVWFCPTKTRLSLLSTCSSSCKRACEAWL